jgi:hypothetical protein
MSFMMLNAVGKRAVDPAPTRYPHANFLYGRQSGQTKGAAIRANSLPVESKIRSYRYRVVAFYGPVPTPDQVRGRASSGIL